uniref:Uncharacterized protein n=1 Tax=Anguilla anguilla TaxID=7936 RepID=A0A0E9VTX1_ANGAN
MFYLPSRLIIHRGVPQL